MTTRGVGEVVAVLGVAAVLGGHRSWSVGSKLDRRIGATTIRIGLGPLAVGLLLLLAEGVFRLAGR